MVVVRVIRIVDAGTEEEDRGEGNKGGKDQALHEFFDYGFPGFIRCNLALRDLNDTAKMVRLGFSGWKKGSLPPARALKIRHFFPNQAENGRFGQ